MPLETQYLGRYEIVEELGHGAMGTVYRARDPRIDRVVAIKTIKLQAANAEEEADYRKRFFREAQAAGKLAHPGIVTIYDVGEDEATHTPFIVMEFIAGQTLEKFAATPLPVDVALDLIKQVAEALDYAHLQGIIHRDIKPANIMVSEDGRARIADFGIAKLEHSEYTMPGQILGTPCFMSPEQLKGEPVTGRSDIFALGVILYTLLAGQRPFEADSVPAITFQVAYKDPAPVTEKNPSLGPYFNEVVARSLAKDPAQRYQRGKELARDIDDLRNGRVPRSISGVAGESSKAMTALGDRSAGRSASLPPLATSGADRTVRTGAGAAPAPAVVPPDGATIVRGSTSTSVQVPTPAPMPATVVESTTPVLPTTVAQPQSSGGKSIWLVIAAAIVLVGWFAWSRIQAPSTSPSRDDTTTSSEQGSVGRSDLRFVCVHSFAAGQFTVWVDDDQVLIGKLTPRKREFIQSVHVPGGKHSVRVRVTSRNDAYDQTRDVKADFPAGGELTIYANTTGGDLSLEIR